MRIAFLIGAFPSLSETFILNQITGLIDRGHQVDIFADPPRRESRVHPAVARYDLLRRTRYAAVPPPLARWLAFGLLARGVRQDWRRTARALNVFRFGFRAASLWLLRASEPFWGQAPYDIVHCHFGANGLKAALFSQIGALQGKLVTSFHGDDIVVYPQKMGRRVYDPLWKTGDLFLPISPSGRDPLIALGAAADKIVVHPVGVDCTEFSPPADPRKASLRPRAVTVARLVEKKEIEYGIRAIGQLARRGRPMEYAVVGDGPLRPQLERLIAELGLGDQVKLLGWLDQVQVRAVLENSHVYLAPSVRSAPQAENRLATFLQDVRRGQRARAESYHDVSEGTPVSIMEAMAMGLPVVATRHGGIPELVQDGESGWLVPERDVAALADRLADLIDHPRTQQEVGDCGRRFVQEHHNIDRLNDRLVEIYRTVVGG